MTELDTPRIRQALAAARDLSKVEGARGGATSFSTGRRLPQSKHARALAAEQLVRMGFDATAVDRELAAERAQSHAGAVAQSGVRADSLRPMVDARRAALGGVVGIGPPTTQYLSLDSPVEIWATDGINLDTTTIEPYKSRAHFRLAASLYENLIGAYQIEWDYQLVHFYYL